MIVATECPIETKIIPWENGNRPGLPMVDPSFASIHEVGNTSPGADEDMHEAFVRNGGGEHKVSFQGVCGPTKFIQLMPMNEAAWHASDGYYGRGNRDSFAIETIQIGDFNKTLNHLAWVVAEMFRNPRRFYVNPAYAMIDDLPSEQVKERVKQHNYWAPDKKNCPQFIRDRGLWEPFLNAVWTELNGKKQAEKYQPAILPRFWSEQAMDSGLDYLEDGVWYMAIKRKLEALRAAPCYRTGLDTSKGKTRPSLEIGEDVIGRFFVSYNGVNWIVTKYGTWIRASALYPYINVSRKMPRAAKAA